MEYNPLLVVFNALLLIGAGLVYILPLRKRKNWLCWIPAALALSILVMELGYHSDGEMVVVYHILTYLVLFLMVNRCTKMSMFDVSYCAVWIFITAEAVQEVWFGIRLSTVGVQVMDLKSGLELMACAAVLFVIISRTIARWMPQGDIYQVLPSQLISAFLLGGMFIALSYLFMLPENRNPSELAVIALCQIYCVSILYLQTEVAKRRSAERKLDMLNLLCNFGAQQYATALHNVSIVNKKCEELEQKIRQMEQYLPEEFQNEARTSIDDALRACDTVVESGNEVLDIVLTEKKLLAETSGTQIHCVADGKLLGFMETVDIYTLFSYALEMAMDEVAGISDENHRLIDLVIHESQNFVVIYFCHPLRHKFERERVRFSGGKNRASLDGFKIMVIYKLLEKYRGMCSSEKKDGFFTMKIVIPLSQK